MVVSVPVGTVRGVTQVGSDSSAGVLSTPGAAVVPGWSDAVVMQMVRRAFFTAIKRTVINRTKIGIFDPDAGGLMEANEASTSSVTAMMSPSAFGGLTAAWTDPPYALLDLTGAPIAAAEG